MKIGTPNNIDVLLHFHLQPNQAHPRSEARAVQEAIFEFLKAGVLLGVVGTEGTYHLTPLGTAWVRALEHVELPRQVFVDEQDRILK